MISNFLAWNWNILVIVLIFFAYKLLHFLFLKPLSDIKFYQNQGCKMSFFPLLGTIKIGLDSLSLNKDFYADWKENMRRDPKLKAFGGNFLDKTRLCLVDTKLIKELSQKPENYIKFPLVRDLFKIIAGDGLGMIEGKVWKKHRRVIGSAFQHEFLTHMTSDILIVANQFLEDLKHKDLDNIHLIKEFEIITGEVVGRLFFGAKFSEYKIQGQPVISCVSEMIIRAGSEGNSLLYMLFGIRLIKSGLLPRHKKLMKDWRDFDRVVNEIVEKKKTQRQKDLINTNKSKSLIDILLDYNEKTEANDHFSTQDIIDEFKTFVGAGMSTTASLIGMAVFYLHQNPKYKPKLMDEVEKYFKTDLSQINLETLNQMEYMTAFMKETMRCVPVLPGLIDREAIRDHTLGDLQIKKGTIINVGILANNFNPLYHDEEEVFNPERWLNTSKTTESVAKDPYVFIPFSSGPRNCIGQHVGMNEAKIIFGLFLKKYDFILSSEYDHGMTQGLVYEPVKSMRFKVISKYT